MPSRGFSGREVVKALTKNRFFIVDRTGSHVKLRYEHPTNDEDVRVVSVPMHDRIDTGTLRSIAGFIPPSSAVTSPGVDGGSALELTTSVPSSSRLVTASVCGVLSGGERCWGDPTPTLAARAQRGRRCRRFSPFVG
jgi:predicted RNA binding protein YcfA (HicA-like mRNA interferase family)